MRGDLWVLYLAWLASAARLAGADVGSDDEEAWDEAEERDEMDGDDLIEPPVPPGLGQLTAPLRAFMQFFDVDQDLVGAAATASPPLKATGEPIERGASQSAPSCCAACARLAGRPVAGAAPRRTFTAIAAVSEEVRRQRKERERQEAEHARLAKLDALAKREQADIWVHYEGDEQHNYRRPCRYSGDDKGPRSSATPLSFSSASSNRLLGICVRSIFSQGRRWPIRVTCRLYVHAAVPR